MEQIENIKRFNWENKIEVSLTLWELQMIRDAIGGASEQLLKGSFQEAMHDGKENPNVSSPYGTYNSYPSYKDLKKILKENGGVTA